jgi:hypothetical protein
MKILAVIDGITEETRKQAEAECLKDGRGIAWVSEEKYNTFMTHIPDGAKFCVSVLQDDMGIENLVSLLGNVLITKHPVDECSACSEFAELLKEGNPNGEWSASTEESLCE